MSRGNRLRALLIAAVSVVLMAAPAQAEIDVEGDDTEAPVLTAVRLAPATVDVSSGPATVAVTYDATDDVSGLLFGFFGLRGPGVTYDSSSSYSVVDGTDLDGTFTTTITIPRHAPAGTYTLSSCSLRDRVGHSSAGSCPTAPTVTVVNPQSDAAPPSLHEVALSPAVVDTQAASRSVTVTYRASDDVSGLLFGFFGLRGPGVTYSSSSSYSVVDGTDRDGTFTTTITLPRHAPAGTYTLVSCQLRDRAQRSSSSTCPTAPTVTVHNEVSDLERPVLSTVSLSPSSVDVTSSSAVVTVTYRATDDVSGLLFGFFGLRGPGVTYSSSSGYSVVDGTDRDGTFTTTITIPRHAPVGSYALSSCGLRDRVSRESTSVCPEAAPIDIVDRSVDLATTLTASRTSVAPGQEFDLTAEVTSSGPSGPVEPTLTFAIPDGATLTALPARCGSADGQVTCELDEDALVPGGQVTLKVGMRAGATAHGTLELSASATSSSTERTPDDNAATLSLPVTAPAPTGDTALSLGNSVSPAEALPGDTVTYTLTATNAAGAGVSTSTVVTDVLPDGVTFLDASEGCTHAAGEVRCELGTVAAGTTKSATVRATVDPMPMRPDPNTAHQVLEQKAETDLRVERGQVRTATASCPSGYFATDGGIRLDAVDQGGDVSRTSVPASGPTADGTGWTATLSNDNPGAALAKVTVACLARTTVTGDHQHDLVSTTVTAPAQQLAAGSTTVTVECGPGRTPYAPAYDVPGGLVTASQAAGSSWRFVAEAAAAGTGDFAVSCLDTRTTSAAGHYHVLGIEQRSETVTVPSGQTVEKQLTCASEAKGIVASRRVDVGLVDRGTDPRAKIRSFRFTNPTGHALTADLGLTCLDIRTSGEPVSTRITNTATVSTTATDASTADDTASATFTAYGDGWAIVPTGAATVAGNARSVSVPLRCATDCAVAARLSARGQLLASRSLSVSGGETQRVSLRATRAGVRALARRGVKHARLVVQTSDGATYSRAVHLRR